MFDSGFSYFVLLFLSARDSTKCSGSGLRLCSSTWGSSGSIFHLTVQGSLHYRDANRHSIIDGRVQFPFDLVVKARNFRRFFFSRWYASTPPLSLISDNVL